MQKFFDSQNNRLVFIGEKSNANFWDTHWDISNFREKVTRVSKHNFVVRLTKEYLHPEDGPILEGGCGMGQNVYALQKNGFRCIGIDYAQKTVAMVNEIVPEIDVRYGDVRELEFEDRFFAGYWSLGVIEHFHKGFDGVALEMKRVLRSGGYLLLSFPCLSKLRRKKIDRNRYDLWTPSPELEANFYQFALSGDHVHRVFRDLGFELVLRKSTNGLKGFKDETSIASLRRLLQRLYDSVALPGKAFVYGLDLVLSPFAGHSELMVLQRMD